MLGVGLGALPSDAYMLGIESTTQRARMEEGLGVILRLLYEDEPVTHTSDWFTLQEAALQLRPLQQRLPVAVASQISPAGMQTAGKFGTQVLSIGSYSEQGLRALPTQWQIGQTVAAEHSRGTRAHHVLALPAKSKGAPHPPHGIGRRAAPAQSSAADSSASPGGCKRRWPPLRPRSGAQGRREFSARSFMSARSHSHVTCEMRSSPCIWPSGKMP